MNAASKHVCSSLLLAKGKLLRPGIDSLGSQDVINGAVSIRACSGMPRCCCKRLLCFPRPLIFHSNTDVSATHDVPCLCAALAGSIQVIHSLLGVRKAEDGCSCVNWGGHEQSVLV